jgi:Zn-dependent protease/CBS domain-containing protein
MRTWSISAGRWLGVEFRLHVSFLFMLFFVLLYDSTHNNIIAIGVIRGVALSALVTACVVVHELGHVVVSARAGVPMRGSMLTPLGGIALADSTTLMENSRNLSRELRIALAGPLANLFMAGVSGAILLASPNKGYLWAQPLLSVNALGRSFFWINLGLCAINLLPAFPLDGGRVFRAWRAQRADFSASTRQAVNLGHIFAATFMLMGVAWSRFGWSPWLLLVGLILFMATQMEERSAMFQSVVEAVQMEDIMLTQFSVLSPADTLQDALYKAVHSLQDDFPVVSNGDLIGVITRQTIVEQLRREGNGYVQGAMSRAFEIAGRDESLASAFRKLTSKGLTLIPVVDQERLVGIVTLQNLMHSMGLLHESRRLRKQMEE